MYSKVWRTCLVVSVSVGLAKLWLDHPVGAVVALPVAAAFLHLLLWVWHLTLTSDMPSPPPGPTWQTAVDTAVIALGVIGLVKLEVLLGLVALGMGVATSPPVVRSAAEVWSQRWARL